MNYYIDKFFETDLFPEVYPKYKPKANYEELEKKCIKNENMTNEMEKFQSLSQKYSEFKFEECKPYQNRISVFLGIFPVRNKLEKLKELVKNIALTKMNSADHFLKTYLEDLIKESPKISTFVESPHITALLINGDKEKIKSAQFKKFKLDYQMNLEILKLIIVPNKFIIALCSVDQSVIEIESNYPYMLLVKGNEWIPNQTQEFLKELNANACLKEIQEEIVSITINSLRTYIIKNTLKFDVLAESRGSLLPDEF